MVISLSMFIAIHSFYMIFIITFLGTRVLNPGDGFLRIFTVVLKGYLFNVAPQG